MFSKISHLLSKLSVTSIVTQISFTRFSKQLHFYGFRLRKSCIIDHLLSIFTTFIQFTADILLLNLTWKDFEIVWKTLKQLFHRISFFYLLVWQVNVLAYMFNKFLLRIYFFWRFVLKIYTTKCDLRICYLIFLYLKSDYLLSHIDKYKLRV